MSHNLQCIDCFKGKFQSTIYINYLKTSQTNLFHDKINQWVPIATELIVQKCVGIYIASLIQIFHCSKHTSVILVLPPLYLYGQRKEALAIHHTQILPHTHPLLMFRKEEVKTSDFCFCYLGLIRLSERVKNSTSGKNQHTDHK